MSSAVLMEGFLLGGFYEISSPILCVYSVSLMVLGVKLKRISFLWAAIFYLLLFALRILAVDLRNPLSYLVTFTFIGLRLDLAAIGIVACLWLADWIRKKSVSASEFSQWIFFPLVSIISTLLLVVFVHDRELKFVISIMWGIIAFSYLLFGFRAKESLYRWTGLILFGVVVLRLFFVDLAAVSTLYRIASFLVLGVVLISASFLYTYYSKKLLSS